MFKPKREKPKTEMPKEVVEITKALEGTLEAVLLNEKMEQIERLPVSQLAEKLQEMTGVDIVIFDGIITQRIVDVASEKGHKANSRFTNIRSCQAIINRSVDDLADLVEG